MNRPFINPSLTQKGAVDYAFTNWRRELLKLATSRIGESFFKNKVYMGVVYTKQKLSRKQYQVSVSLLSVKSFLSNFCLK